MLWLLERRRLATILPQLIRPPRIDLDLRSLALFRILLGVYLVIETLYARLWYGKYDLAWYTSDHGTNPHVVQSYLEATDSPHKSPLHQFWFYRGSAHVQIILFATTALTAALLALGYRSNGSMKVLLLILVTAQQNRNMHVHDGSDNYCRHLLLWSCFLPLSNLWSLDAVRSTHHHAVRHAPPTTGEKTTRATGTTTTTTTTKPTTAKTQISTTTTVVATLPAYALALQIVLMYSGTVFARTWDRYPTLTQLWKDCDWLPPQLSAIHYALSTSFAVRDGVWLTNLIRRYAWVGQGATLSGLLVEATCPVLCWYMGPRRRMYFCLPLVALHVVLLIQMRLPQWQYLAILSHTIWIPSHVWDNLFRLQHALWPASDDRLQTAVKKTERDTTSQTLTNNSDQPRCLHVHRREPNRSGILSKSLQWFFVSYMVYNFAGERKWIAKHDSGDIGEGLRLSQYWVMYASAPKTAHTVRLSGLVPAIASTKDSKRNSKRRIDLFHFISSRGELLTDEINMNTVPLDMSRRYPSARWERAWNEWASRSYTQPEYGRQRVRHMAQALCSLINDDLYSRRLDSLIAIEVILQHSIVNPPGSFHSKRYADQRAAVDTVVTVPCQPWPSPRQPEHPKTEES